MLKDLIFKSKRNLERENDKLPLFMRGELEVIVRDENDNIVSYEKGDNVVSDFMKHEIIHLLAGDLFTDKETNHTNNSVDIYTSLDTSKHSTDKNEDGMLFSGRPLFYDPSNLPLNFVIPKVDIENTGVSANYINPRYPVKMLFGTGSEYGVGGWESLTSEYGGENAIDQVLGYAVSDDFELNISNDKNYYSDTYQQNTPYTPSPMRTVQAKNTEPITNHQLQSNNVFGVKGAIKNCLIEKVDDLDEKWEPSSEMAKTPYRGIGRPSFIYASRDLNSVKTNDITDRAGFVKIGESQNNLGYDNKLMFSVVMPRTSSFYPYNGWILKEAGLFSDSLFRVNGEPVTGVTDKMPCGTLLAKRYITPVLKTADNSIEFIWSIYISPN